MLLSCLICIKTNGIEVYEYKNSQGSTLISNRKPTDPNIKIEKTTTYEDIERYSILVRDHQDSKKRVYYKYNGYSKVPDFYKECQNDKNFSHYCQYNLTAKEVKGLKDKIEILLSNDMDAITRYKQIYIAWEGNGKIGPPPLKPKKITNELVFVPIVAELLLSGEAVIDMNVKALPYSYGTYKSCMSEKYNNIAEFKKSYKAVLRKDIVFPKDLTRRYTYRCESDVQAIHRSIPDI